MDVSETNMESTIFNYRRECEKCLRPVKRSNNSLFLLYFPYIVFVYCTRFNLISSVTEDDGDLTSGSDGRIMILIS